LSARSGFWSLQVNRHHAERTAGLSIPEENRVGPRPARIRDTAAQDKDERYSFAGGGDADDLIDSRQLELRDDGGVIGLGELHVRAERPGLVRQDLVVDLRVAEESEHLSRDQDMVDHLAFTDVQ